MGLISQRFAIENRLKATPVSRHNYAVDDHPITIYGSHELVMQAKDSHNISRKSKRTFYAIDIRYYDVILGREWLDNINPDICWPKREWFYRDSTAAVQILLVEDFKKSLKEDIIIYAFYGASAESDKPEWRPPCDSHGIRIYSVEIDVIEIPEKYKDFEKIFSKKKCKTVPEGTQITYAINLIGGSETSYRPIYPLLERELRILRDYFAEKEIIDWIRRFKSLADSSILFVPKSDGFLRLCVDYRALNKITVKNRHSLPLINEAIDRLAGAKIFIKLDLRDAYHRVRIKPEDEWKTAFRTRYGHWEYTIMSFGLTNAPATFQAYINEAL